MRRILFLIIFSLFLFSCTKDNPHAGESIEIYQLQSYNRVAGKCQVEEASAVLQNDPIVENSEILSYSAASYEFTLAPAAWERVKTAGDGSPFALAVDGRVIFYGFFKPFISSSSCDHSITIDYTMGFGKNRIRMSLGYPTGGSTGIDDRRNDPKLIATLVKQGKLE